MRDSIVFYKSFIEALKELPDDNRLELYDAIFDFGIYDKEPVLDGINAAMFALIRPQIEANNRKYENGLKGGRPKNQNETKAKPNNNQTKTKTKPNNNQSETKVKPNDNDNDNDNDNVNENENENVSVPDIALSLISFLNEKTGSTYSDTEQVRDLIEERIEEGYTESDLRSVIEKKCSEWNCDGKMRSYLRPSTLFGDKFEEYLNGPEPMEVQDERNKSEKVEQLQNDLEGKRWRLKQIQEQIDIIHNGGQSEVKKRFDELTELNFNKGILEQDIDNIVRRLEAAS